MHLKGMKSNRRVSSMTTLSSTVSVHKVIHDMTNGLSSSSNIYVYN